MTEPSKNWIDAAIRITAGFETNGDPYLDVSGNFDEMGISCGVLQWNIGQGSLQPMVQRAGEQTVLAAMPTHGTQMWRACTSDITTGLTIVRGWQSANRLNARAKAELVNLLDTDEMRAAQDAALDRVAVRAARLADKWAQEAGLGASDKRLFCWFFDLITQNGGLENLAPQQVTDFLQMHTPSRADDFICDFLAGQSGGGHAQDAQRNAAIWRNQATAPQLHILCMSYLRSKTAHSKWRHVVLNRKGTIAMGQGWVNSTQKDLSVYGL